MQVANVYVCRNETAPTALRGWLGNRIIVAGVLVELGLVAVIDYTVWGNTVIGTAPINWTVWLVPLPFAAGLIGADRLLKQRRQARPAVGLGC
jgi:hypothetical protein